MPPRFPGLESGNDVRHDLVGRDLPGFDAMTLQQAASPSADSFSNAVAFVLVAAIVRLAMDDTVVRSGRPIVAGAAVLLTALALTKLNVFLYLPAAAIPSKRFAASSILRSRSPAL